VWGTAYLTGCQCHVRRGVAQGVSAPACFKASPGSMSTRHAIITAPMQGSSGEIPVPSRRKTRSNNVFCRDLISIALPVRIHTNVNKKSTTVSIVGSVLTVICSESGPPFIGKTVKRSVKLSWNYFFFKCQIIQRTLIKLLTISFRNNFAKTFCIYMYLQLKRTCPDPFFWFRIRVNTTTSWIL
jgi:hypothetical protein